MTSGLISVLLPYRNADHVIHRALISIAVQLENHELILVENQVESSDVVEQFIAQHPHLNIRKIKELRPGIVFALNTGIEHCTGEFIARMDADDEMLANRLKLQSEYLINHASIDLVSGMVEYAGDAEKNEGFSLYVKQINAIKSSDEISTLRFLESPFAHPSVMLSMVAIYTEMELSLKIMNFGSDGCMKENRWRKLNSQWFDGTTMRIDCREPIVVAPKLHSVS
jgi:glycosyltransferase involved in cell wall biosynthesis